MNENQLSIVRNLGEPAPAIQVLEKPMVHEPAPETTPLENYQPAGCSFDIEAAVAQSMTMGITGWCDREALTARENVQVSLLGLIDGSHAVELVYQFDSGVKAAQIQLLHDGHESPNPSQNKLFGAALSGGGCFVLSSGGKHTTDNGAWRQLRYETDWATVPTAIGFKPHAVVTPIALPKWSSSLTQDLLWAGRAFEQIAQLKWKGEIRVRVRKIALAPEQLMSLENARPQSGDHTIVDLLNKNVRNLVEIQIAFRCQGDSEDVPEAAIAFSRALLPHRTIARFSSVKSGLADLQPIESLPLLLPSPADWVNGGGRRLYLSLHDLPPLDEAGIVVGETILHDGTRRKVTLQAVAMSRHVYIRGQSGTGKTELLFNLAMDRAQAGESLVVIDPHGDLTSRLEQAFRAQFPQRLSILSPGRRYSVRCNPLDLGVARGRRAKQALANILKNDFIALEKTVLRLDSENSGPGREQVLGAGLLLAMTARHDVDGNKLGKSGATLNVLRDLFRNRDYREKLLVELPSSFLSKNIQKDVVAVFEDMMRTSGDASFDNWVPYVVHKLAPFTTDTDVADVLCHPAQSLNMRRLIDSGGILLLNLSKGRFGLAVPRLIGALTLRNVFRAAMSRTDQKERDRRPVCLIVDEFQNFLTQDAAEMFAEARKYRLQLAVAHQSASQMESMGGGNLLAGIMANTANKFFFRQGPQDAESVERLLAPQFDRSMLTRLDDYHAVAQLQCGNRLAEPFVLRTIPGGAV